MKTDTPSIELAGPTPLPSKEVWEATLDKIFGDSAQNWRVLLQEVPLADLEELLGQVVAMLRRQEREERHH